MMLLKKGVMTDGLKISEILSGLLEKHKSDEVYFGEIVESLHERGFGFLLIIFVLPNCVPVPIPPGMSTVFSIPLLFLTAQMVIGFDSPWLPKWLKKRKIKQSTLVFMIEKLLPRLRWLETFLKPRLGIGESSKKERLLGFMCLLLAISIAVPLPMTNFLPGIGILVASIGIISRDGAVVILGCLIGAVGIVVTSMVIVLGQKAALAIINKFSPPIY